MVEIASIFGFIGFRLVEIKKMAPDGFNFRFRSFFLGTLNPKPWVLPPSLTNSWIIDTIWFYIALNRTPNLDCYWVGGSTQPKP